MNLYFELQGKSTTLRQSPKPTYFQLSTFAEQTFLIKALMQENLEKIKGG